MIGMSTYEDEEAGAQGHDFIGNPVHVGCNHGGGAEGAAGKCDTKGQ